MLLPEISFIQEMRTTWGNKEVSQALLLYSPYPQKQIYSVWLCWVANGTE